MNMPHMELRDQVGQANAMIDFCSTWNGPVQVEYQGKQAILMPLPHYLHWCCTEEKIARLPEELHVPGKVSL